MALPSRNTAAAAVRRAPAPAAATPAAAEPAQGAALGNGHNVQFAVQDNTLYLMVRIDDSAIKAAPASQTGKTNTVGSTSGFAWLPSGIDGIDIGVSLNVSAKRKAR